MPVSTKRFVKIVVDIRNHWIYKDAYYYSWWTDLIMSAAWKGYQQKLGKTELTIRRGQQLISVRFLQERWRYRKDCRGKQVTPSHQRITGFLKELERDGMITMDKRKEGTIVTICNYDKYQSKPVECETQELIFEELEARRNGDYDTLEKINQKRREISEKKMRAEGLKMGKEKQFEANVLHSDLFLKESARTFSTDKESIKELIKTFTLDSCITGSFHSNDSHYRNSFYKWCKKRKEKQGAV